MRTGTATVAIVLLLACSSPAQQPASIPTGSDVAAQVGTRTITVQELDERWQQAEPAARTEAVQKLYDGRKAALDDIIAEMLLTQAAEAKGTKAEQLLEEEIARRVKPVTDAEIAAFFEQNKGQMGGRDFQTMAPLIRRYLDEQRRARARQDFVSELRKAGPPIRVALDAPRHDIAVHEDDPTMGAADAPVTLVEFSDFQCPFCAQVMPTIKRVREAYGDRVRIVWKDFPLTALHPQAFKAAEAGQCAREQGKFWEYHDRLFANQKELQPEFLKKYAADAGLDAAAFNACLDSGKHSERVQEQIGLGTRVGVTATPASFVNGRLVSGAQPYETFAAIIDEELERARAK